MISTEFSCDGTRNVTTQRQRITIDEVRTKVRAAPPSRAIGPIAEPTCQTMIAVSLFHVHNELI